MKSRALFICIFNWYPKPPECRHQLGLEPQRRVPGARIITGAKSPVPGTPPASSHTEGGSAGYR